MLITTLKTLFQRDLSRLKQEIESYRDEKNIWLTDKDISNSAGNLCLHLVGNLNTYIGKELGHTGYTRNRDLEFSQKDVPRNTLLEMINATMKVVDETLHAVKPETLTEEYPLLVYEQKLPTGAFLIYLATHLTYHLGQINYHRRLLDGD